MRLQARLLVIGVCCIASGVVAAAGGAENPNADRQRADALRRQNTTLAQRMHDAMLDLYSIDSRLRRAESQLTSVRSRRERLARERRSVRLRLDVSLHNLHRSQSQLAVVIRSLYEQQSSDPLAVMLGASSLEDAISTLDDLGRTAAQHEQIAARSRTAKLSLAKLTHTLANQDARLRVLEAVASKAAASLAGAKANRRYYIRRLAEEQRFNDAQISRLNARAEASVAASAAIAIAAHNRSPSTAAAATAAAGTTSPADVAPTASPADVAPTASPADITPTARSLTVVATGYAMNGSTATGLPVGWGIVAVDPSVIALGTRMTIPGYGEGVAADTGSAIQGSTIDLWFPTAQRALAWGRRVITIQLH